MRGSLGSGGVTGGPGGTTGGTGGVTGGPTGGEDDRAQGLGPCRCDRQGNRRRRIRPSREGRGDGPRGRRRCRSSRRRTGTDRLGGGNLRHGGQCRDTCYRSSGQCQQALARDRVPLSRRHRRSAWRTLITWRCQLCSVSARRQCGARPTGRQTITDTARCAAGLLSTTACPGVVEATVRTGGQSAVVGWDVQPGVSAGKPWKPLGELPACRPHQRRPCPKLSPGSSRLI